MAAKKSARKIVRTINRSATPAEGVGVVKRISTKGMDTKFIKRSTRQVRRELGGTAAKAYKAAATNLDRNTYMRADRRTAARTAAKKTARRLSK